jgi:hypothetical protein
MFFSLFYSLLKTAAADDFLDDIDEPEDWDWETIGYIAAGVTLAIVILILLKKRWKKYKKHRKHSSKHAPLLVVDNHHRPNEAFHPSAYYPPPNYVYPPAEYGQYPPPGYPNQGVYPYLPQVVPK